MRFSLINPAWSFDGSIYFGCREPHLPLEFGYAKVLLERAGHEVQIVDGQLEGLDDAAIRERVGSFTPHFTVITTAPSYLFWRCPPPEIRVPQTLAAELVGVRGILVCVGPHASATPKAALRKMDADIAVIGECEEILPKLAGPWKDLASIAYWDGGEIRVQGSTHSSDMSTLPALHWDGENIARHAHHHHRFDSRPEGPGVEMEASRGRPYHRTYSAKDNFRNGFRRRPLEVIAEELDGLIAGGAEYVYFIDEIFLPFRDVLEVIGSRRIAFGIQTRIDLWSSAMIDLLGNSGCVSIEAGVESTLEAGRAELGKKCKISTAEIAEKLIRARRVIPFVQANLLDSAADDPEEVDRWRRMLRENGVWANEPVPLFPYPGSPDYARRWGPPDDRAWERAHEFYLQRFEGFSDVEDQRPAPLVQLEALR